MAKGKLFFFCGKMGAGKSTKSKQVSAQQNAVLLSEDEWLATLYPKQIASFEDYLKFSAVIKPLVKSHVQNILMTGTHVVMDFPANTRSQRQWLLSLSNEIGAEHRLIFLNPSDAVCLKQIEQRRAEQPERAAFDSKEMFYHVSQFFEAPSQEEGLVIEEIEQKAAKS